MSWLKEQIGNEWYDLLNPILKSPDFKDDFASINKDLETTLCYPDKNKVFRAFEECKLKDLKVILIGQDPYHDGSATGLCFDTGGKKVTPSLRMINGAFDKEYPDNFNTALMEGNLEHWSKQGILMLNTALTVKAGKANSHAKYWRYFTYKLFKELNKIKRPLLFIAWGTNAKTLVDETITSFDHSIIKALHPAAAIYKKIDWDSNNTFISTQQWLKDNYKQQIRWNID